MQLNVALCSGLLGLSLLTGVPAAAQTSTGPAHQHDHAPVASGAASSTIPADQRWVEGEVRRVDKAQGKLTLRHGEIPNLAMPAMTMVFRVVEPAWLDTLKVGDKVRFRAESRQGVLTVTALEAGGESR
ncbi:MAG TPA: copper-binding protein [Aquabacterium sp.]|nr:copper-binding protein [Aquabacterium sp.]